MEIFKNVKNRGKWKFTIKKMTFWPNIKCNVPGNIMMHMGRALVWARLSTNRSWNRLVLSWKSHGT